MRQASMMGRQEKLALIGLLALALAIESVSCVITVQIGGATRLTSLSRSRDRYSCYWDCDLVGCQIARDDDECAYDCEKICRVRYDYATVGRSGSQGALAAANSDLKPKSGAVQDGEPGAKTKETSGELPAELLGVGASVRLHLPRNATAKSFAIMDNCAQFN